jgi:hypothetical protein
MAGTLSWHNSELLPIEAASGTPMAHLPGSLRLRFAVAFVCLEGQGKASNWGYLKPLDLFFEHAVLEGCVADCVGQIMQGALWLAHDPPLGTGHSTVSLPWVVNEPLRLVLRFRQGGELTIRAASARGAPPDDARFTESFAC